MQPLKSGIVATTMRKIKSFNLEIEFVNVRIMYIRLDQFINKSKQTYLIVISVCFTLIGLFQEFVSGGVGEGGGSGRAGSTPHYPFRLPSH